MYIICFIYIYICRFIICVVTLWWSIPTAWRGLKCSKNYLGSYSGKRLLAASAIWHPKSKDATIKNRRYIAEIVLSASWSWHFIPESSVFKKHRDIFLLRPIVFIFSTRDFVASLQKTCRCLLPSAKWTCHFSIIFLGFLHESSIYNHCPNSLSIIRTQAGLSSFCWVFNDI